MKKQYWPTVGSLIFLAGFVWVAVGCFPIIGYRYQHPKMTETELQIYFLSGLRWTDLLPVALVATGLFLMMKGKP